MTKPTDSKVPAAFQAMLAFLQYVLTGRYGGVYTLATRYGVDAAMSLLVVGDRATLLALRDLVQAAADEHAGSAAPAAPSDEEEAFRALRLSDIKDNHARAEVSFTGAACTNAHLDRAWLIGEVERLRVIERLSRPSNSVVEALRHARVEVDRLHAFATEGRDERLQQQVAVMMLRLDGLVQERGAEPVRQKAITASGRFMAHVAEGGPSRCGVHKVALPTSITAACGQTIDRDEWSAVIDASVTCPACLRAMAGKLLYPIGVDPAQSGGDRTVTQVREPAFDRLAAAVDALRPHCEGRLLDVTQAFDAFVAARAAEVEPATPAETLTFTRLEGETLEAFRARIALHLNGMGSTRFVLPGQGATRGALGEIVHGVRRVVFETQGLFLAPWNQQHPTERDLDCTIGVALATVGQSIAGAIDAPVLTEEAAQKWAEGMCGAADLAAPADAVTEALLAAARGEYPTT